LAGAEVFTLAHWITDRDLPRRFDALPGRSVRKARRPWPDENQVRAQLVRSGRGTGAGTRPALFFMIFQTSARWSLAR
jgi:hypothetical protein